MGVSVILGLPKALVDARCSDECDPCIRTISLFVVVRRTRLVGPGDKIAAAAASLPR